MIQLNEIAQCPLPIIKSWAAFINPKMYTFRGWRNRAWYTMLRGNKL